MPDAVIAEVPLREAVEMPGPWKAWKTKDRFSTLSTVPWKSRRNRGIPTFPPPGFAALEKWKTNSRFPTFPEPLATTAAVLSLKTKNQRKEVGRCAASLILYAFSLRSNGTDFMLILRLENARLSFRGANDKTCGGSLRTGGCGADDGFRPTSRR
jgi:hypothetical protein